MLGDIWEECITPKNREEAFCAGMCQSMICYGNGLGSYSDKRYLSEYNETIGRERVEEIYNTIKEYVEKNYDIVYAGTDGEGLRYNGFAPKNPNFREEKM